MAHLDAKQSTAQVAVYVKNNGNVSESLTLTKPGTSGRFTYQYVGGGYWQRVVTNSASIDGSIDAFSYGVVTPTAAVPRTGAASYSVDLLGAETTSNNVIGIAGSGTFEADFARNVFAVRGTMQGVNNTAAPFSSQGVIASASNAFSGSVVFRDGDTFVGGVNGRFYGPGAEEVGATWYTRSTTPNFPNVAVGTIIGRRTGALTPNMSFAALTNDQFFGSDAASSHGVITATSSTRTLSDASTKSAALVVYYDATTNSYTLSDVDTRKYFGAPATLYTSTGFSYVRAAKLALSNTATSASGSTQTYDLSDLTFGFETPAAAVPRTGQAGFNLNLYGQVLTTQGGFNSLYGSGAMILDLAAGKVTVSGKSNITSQDNPSAIINAGGFSGSGALSSSANLLSGAVNFNFDSAGAFAGNFTGKLYGPVAQEVGASFAASGTGGVLSGSMIGTRDDSLASAVKPLASFTDKTTFGGYAGNLHWQNTTNIAFPSGGFANPPGRLLPQLTWTPATGTYSFDQALDDPQSQPHFSIAFDASNKVAAESNSTFTVYRRTVGGADWTARIYNTGNGELPLTYTSFALLDRTEVTNGAGATTNDRYFLPFGNATPAALMPKSGTATYTGVLYGNGTVVSGGSVTGYTLNGTSRLAVDFLNSTATGRLVIGGTPIAGGGATSFGTFDMTGQIASNIFSLQQSSSTQSGSFVGQFNGPAAEEFGGVFTIRVLNGADQTLLNGVAVGKR